MWPSLTSPAQHKFECGCWGGGGGGGGGGEGVVLNVNAASVSQVSWVNLPLQRFSFLGVNMASRLKDVFKAQTLYIFA